MNIYKFTQKLHEKLEQRKLENGYTFFDYYTMKVDEGQKYFKVFSQEIKDNKVVNKSIIAFVDKVTGDIFKPASYKVPAKHARGNVFSEQDGMEAITPDGFVKYLK